MDFDLQNTYQSHDFYENLKWSHGQYKSMKIYANSWKSMEIHENIWKTMKIHEIHENVLDIFVLEKEDGLYSIFQEYKRLTYLSSKKK